MAAAQWAVWAVRYLVVQRGGLGVGRAERGGVARGVGGGHGARGRQVRLVADERQHERAGGVALQLFHPALDGGEARAARDVEHEQRRVRVAVVHGRHAAEPLLPRRVPHLPAEPRVKRAHSECEGEKSLTDLCFSFSCIFYFPRLTIIKLHLVDTRT